MLPGVPARSHPAATPHGGTLTPLNTCLTASLVQPCSARQAGRSRPASELALQFIGAKQPHRRQPSRQTTTVRAHERQPGPQEDGCGCSGQASGTQHDHHHQHIQHQNPQHLAGAPASATHSHTADGATSLRVADSSGAVNARGDLEPTADARPAVAAASEHQQRQSPLDGSVSLELKAASAADPLGGLSGVERAVGLPAPGDGRDLVGDSGEAGTIPTSSYLPTPIRDPLAPGSPHSPISGPTPPEGSVHAAQGANASQRQHHLYPHQPQAPQPGREILNSQLPLEQYGSSELASAVSGDTPLQQQGQGHPEHDDVADGDGSGARPEGASSGPLGPLPQGSGSAGVSSGAAKLPPLRLDFLDWSRLQGGAGPGPGSTSRGSSSPPLRGQGGTSRRRRGGASGSGAAASGGRSRSDRVLQLVLAANTLLQVRAVISRHLHEMSPGAAAVALSRLAGLSVATMRLRRAQQQLQPAPRPQPQLQPAPQLPLPSPESQQRSPEEVRSQLGEAATGTATPRVEGTSEGSGAADEVSERRGSSAAAATAPSTTTDDPRVPLPDAVASGKSMSPPPLRPDAALREAAELSAAAEAEVLDRQQQLLQQQGQQQGQQQQQPAQGGAAPGRKVGTPDCDGAPAGGVMGSAPSLAGDGDTDPWGPVQQGSLRLMRLILRHIAVNMDTSASASAAATRGADGKPSLRSARSSSSSWRFPAPEHRARVAGTVLSSLARVGLKPGPSDVWALYRVLEAARPDLFLASPLQLSRLASSLPLLPPLRPSPVWLDHFASVSRSKMYAAETGHLASYVWCLARLGHNPGDLWLHSLTHHLTRDGNLGAATAGQLCQVLWALHRLDFTPDPDWRADCAEVVRRAVTGMNAGGGANRFTSGGAAAANEPGADASVPISDTPSAAATAAAAATSSTYRPSSRYTGRSRPFSRPGRSARSSGRYDRIDDPYDSEEDMYDSSSSMDEFEPETTEAVGTAARGAAASGADLQAGGVATAAAAVVPRRHGGGGYADVASLLLWAVRMRLAPGPAGMQACLERLQPALRSLRRVHLLRLLLALSEAGHRPSEAFMGRLLSCLQPKLPLLGPTQLTQLLVAVSQLRFVPPQSWLVAFLKASRAQLRHYSPAHVTATYQVFAGWQLRPSRPYLTALHSLLDSLLPDFPPQGLAAVLQSMSSLGIKPQHRWVARALDVLVDAAERGATDSAPLTHGSLLDTAALNGGHSFGTFVPTLSVAAPPPPPLSPSGASGSVQQSHTLRQQQRTAAAAALVTAACSLRGIVQFDVERDRTPWRQTAAAGASDSGAAAAGAEAAAAQDTGVEKEDAGQRDDATAAATAAAAVVDGDPEVVVLLPYELWASAKRLTDQCGELLDVMTGPELARLLTALSRANFYPGRAFLSAHARATARLGAQLATADKEALAACYSRLAALAPRMAEEARRQAEARQARAAVLVATDPWVT